MPSPPRRQFSFTDFNVNQLTAPPPGDRLDSEFDRTNTGLGAVIDFLGKSLNTDGTLRSGTVGRAQLTPGLFDHLTSQTEAVLHAQEAAAKVATEGAVEARDAAADSAAEAAASAAQAAASASSAATSETNALASELAALNAANTAAAKASDASNDANHAAGDAALAEDWGIVSQAWAEHMPDTIPPNILAVMGVTGDHWSSRWWANKAAAVFGGAMSELYLGAQPVPPTSTATGDAIPTGAIYYNTTTQQVYVWNGSEWKPITQPSIGIVSQLTYIAAAGQTRFLTTDPDIAGATYPMDPTSTAEVFVNGVRVLLDMPPGAGDFTIDTAASAITFTTPMFDQTVVQIDVIIVAPPPVSGTVSSTALVPFAVDGIATDFPLRLASSPTTPVTPARAAELFVVVDGVPQQPDVDFTVSTSNIHFAEAPLAGARAWALWFQPGDTP